MRPIWRFGTNFCLHHPPPKTEFTMNEKPTPPCWRKDFPVSKSEEHAASRRDFFRLLGLAPVAALAGIAFQRRASNLQQFQLAKPLLLAGTHDLKVGDYKLFQVP